MRSMFSSLYRFIRFFIFACISFFWEPIPILLEGIALTFLLPFYAIALTFCFTFYVLRVYIGLLLNLPGTEKYFLFFAAPNIETNPDQYASILSRWVPRNYILHFPDTLPPAATHVKLSFFPGFLQGRAWFQVRLTLPEREVAEVFDFATQTAISFYDGGDKYRLVNSKARGLPGTSFHTADEHSWHLPFPDDYCIFIFDALRPTSSWSCGVVVSKQRNEVIYYADL